MGQKLLREYYELCEGGICQDLLTEEEKRKLYNQWIKFYRENYWVKQENGRWKFVEWELTKLDLD